MQFQYVKSQETFHDATNGFLLYGNILTIKDSKGLVFFLTKGKKGVIFWMKDKKDAIFL